MACEKLKIEAGSGIKIISTKLKSLKGGRIREIITEVHCEVVGIKSFSKIRKATAKESGASDCL